MISALIGHVQTTIEIDQLGDGAELFFRFKNEASSADSMIKLAIEGAGTQQVAGDFGRSQATIQTMDQSLPRQRDGLLNKGKGNGPQSRLTPEMEKAITSIT